MRICSVVLTVLLVIGTTTPSFANHTFQEPVTDRTMLTQTVSISLKALLVHHYLKHIAPDIKSYVRSRTNSTLPDFVVDGTAIGWLAYQLKEYADCCNEYIQQIIGKLNCRKKKIIFNSFTNDVCITINDSLRLIGKIEDTTISSVASVVITKKDGTFIRRLRWNELENVHAITVTQDPDTGEYDIAIQFEPFTVNLTT